MKTKLILLITGLLFVGGNCFSQTNHARSIGPIGIYERALQGAGSGTRVGGSEGEELFNYCRDSRTLLMQYQQIVRSVQMQGNSSRAVIKAVEGLQHALQTEGDVSNRLPTFTQKSILLAMNVITPQIRMLSSMQTRELDALLKYIDNSYNFIINDVSQNLDFSIYLPVITGRCGECLGEIERFENNYLIYVKKSLDLILNSSVRIMEREGTRTYYTLTHARTFLNMVKIHILHTIDELEGLEQRIYQGRFSCQKDALEITANNIEAFLLGNEGPFFSVVIAVNQVVSSLKRISNNLQTNNCRI